MVKGWMLAIAIASVACTDEEQVVVRTPASVTCAAAVDAYYGAGCTYWVGAGDGQTVPLPHDAMAAACEAASDRPGCGYAVDFLLLCAERASPPACGCGDELAMMLWCR